MKKLTPMKRQKQNSYKQPNLLNDLTFKEWLKFQKSFSIKEITDEEINSIMKEFILFFTKSQYNGAPSRILLNRDIDNQDFKNRILEIIPEKILNDGLIKTLSEKRDGNYNYVIIYLDKIDQIKYYEKLFEELKRISKELSYITIICDEFNNEKPIIWKLANTCRKSLLLCDEKIYVSKKRRSIIRYCLNFRKDLDNVLTEESFEDINFKHSYIKFPSYILPRPPPRNKKEILHPAKFPETLIEEFIELFTKENNIVLDIMCGTGSMQVAAYNKKRNSVGIEINPEFVKITKDRLKKINPPIKLPGFEINLFSKVVEGDARNLTLLLSEYKNKISYCITSPPYWSMLKNPGSEKQAKRRKMKLKLTYSDLENDLSNISNYNEFNRMLTNIYLDLPKIMKKGSKFTIIVKNVKMDGQLYTLAWDIVNKLCGGETGINFLGYTLWLQDDINLVPFAIGHHWISNTLHQYCLHFEID